MQSILTVPRSGNKVIDILLVASVLGVSVPVHHSVESSTFPGTTVKFVEGFIIKTITFPDSFALYTEGTPRSDPPYDAIHKIIRLGLRGPL
jgi:hypothetical protein